MDSTRFEVVVDPGGRLLDLTLECEQSVFFDAYGNSPDELGDEYGRYADTSVFLGLLDRRSEEVVGECRLITPGPAGLKTLDDTSREPWSIDGYRSARAAGVDLNKTFDVATIGVRKRGHAERPLASIALYHAIVMFSRANNLPYIVMIMDARARRLLASVGCATHVLPGTHPGGYLGSAESTPLWAEIPVMLDNQRALNQDAWRLISRGMGLDGIYVPPLSAFVVRRSNSAVAS